MAQQTINVGTAPNDGTGTPLRTAFQYTNSNFSELYTAVGPSGNNIVVPGNATITGDLTVDTSTLKVDSANNRVGVLTASPSAALHVNNGNIRLNDGYQLEFGGGFNSISGTNASNNLLFYTNNVQRQTINSSGVFTWENVGGVAGTAMTLNSTGLGIGTSSPAAALDLTNTGVTAFREIRIENSAVRTFLGVEGSSGRFVGSATNNAYFGCSGAFGLEFATNNNVRMVVDTSGNVGIGITSPSYLLHTSVPTGGDRNMVRFQVSGASSGLTITWNNGTQKMHVNFGDLPTSSAGLPANTLWVDTAAGNTLKLA